MTTSTEAVGIVDRLAVHLVVSCLVDQCVGGPVGGHRIGLGHDRPPLDVSLDQAAAMHSPFRRTGATFR